MSDETKQPQVIDAEAKAVEPEAVREEAAPEQPLETKPGEQDAVAPKQEAPKKEESPVAVGYRVGVRENGEFIFEIIGSRPGLVEVLGVHEFAQRKVSLLYDRAQVEGQAAVAVQFNQMMKKFDSTIETFRDLLNTMVVSNASKPKTE